MKTLNIKQFDEKDEEIADALISLGMNRPVARTLASLRNEDETTTKELERSTGLCQPEVSIGMKELRERNWITEREEKKPGKGRPYKIYSLKIGFKDIVVQLENKQKKAVNEERAKIKRLKELGK